MRSESGLAAELEGPPGSLLDLVDNLLEHGVVINGSVVLGLAGVDLVYLELSVLLSGVDRLTRHVGGDGSGS